MSHVTAQWPDVVDTTARAEHERLELLQRVFDPFSLRNLDRIGVTTGWRCLEVGAGGGSIARALAERAGGRNVTATDLSTRLLTPLSDLGVTVLEHDVLVDEAPGEFDFVHCRFVLSHLPQRDLALRRMASWLKPGGWLLVEDGATAPETSSRLAVRRALTASNAALTWALGTNISWARTLPLPLEATGLVDCDAEATTPPVRGGSPIALWLRDSFRMTDERAIAAGLITPEDFDEAYACYEDPSFVDYTWLTVAAWGRRG